MERKITLDLIKWKVDKTKKPLLLYGISSCGKTHTVLDFGKKEYKNIIYFDCFNNLELNYVFEKNTTLDKLIRGLSAIFVETIFQEESLIVFDNVTAKILKAVKKVFAGISAYHIICITDDKSMIDAKSNELTIKRMNLVSFDEYLRYIGKEQLIGFIEDSFKSGKEMPFHAMAYESFNDYVLTGSYPEAIIKFNEAKDYNLLSTCHEKNIKLMKNKLFDLDNLIDIKRCNEIFDSVSFQLLKDNKKFVYGLIKDGGRAKDYTRAIDFLVNNNLAIKSYRVNKLKAPLSNIKDQDSFKLYFNDCGLLYKKMNISGNRLLTNEKLLNIIYENNVVSTLFANGFNIYYYHSEGKSELDLVVQTRTGKIIPIEMLKESNSNKSKSLGLAMKNYELPLGMRFTYDNFHKKKNVMYIPYYAAFCIQESL